MMSRFMRVMPILIFGCIVGALFYVQPHLDRTLRIANVDHPQLPLPSALIGIRGIEGERLLAESDAKADFVGLQRYFEPQVYRSFCGVATGVVIKNALHSRSLTSQSTWFDERPDGHRSAYQTFFGGMSLDEFVQLVESHGLNARKRHGGTLSLESFRALVKTNLSNSADLLVVNYHRGPLGQEGGGHFSPIAAYHEGTDRVLLLDVAAHRYPPAWVPLDLLWQAIDTTDFGAKKQRGLVEVSKG